MDDNKNNNIVVSDINGPRQMPYDSQPTQNATQTSLVSERILKNFESSCVAIGLTILAVIFNVALLLDGFYRGNIAAGFLLMVSVPITVLLTISLPFIFVSEMASYLSNHQPTKRFKMITTAIGCGMSIIGPILLVGIYWMIFSSGNFESVERAYYLNRDIARVIVLISVLMLGIIPLLFTLTLARKLQADKNTLSSTPFYIACAIGLAVICIGYFVNQQSARAASQELKNFAAYLPDNQSYTSIWDERTYRGTPALNIHIDGGVELTQMKTGESSNARNQSGFCHSTYYQPPKNHLADFKCNYSFTTARGIEVYYGGALDYYFAINSTHIYLHSNSVFNGKQELETFINSLKPQRLK